MTDHELDVLDDIIEWCLKSGKTFPTKKDMIEAYWKEKLND